ncbi:hypothetical protein EDB83DRAFT_2386483 [Lactarius deliciosus]|nr:hypothetical protein EDB83DRAFT_2386483 [Lactarius deliciosus]
MSSPAHPSSSPNFSQRSFGSGGLPPLPHIMDRRLQTQIFTHRSLARRPKHLFPNLSVGPSSVRLIGLFYPWPCAVLYRLHDRLLVQPAQASEVKVSQNAQENNAREQAYVGGLYREQGMGPVNDWLRSLFQLYVLDAYENIRREHLLPPVQTPHAPTLRSVS